MDIWLKPDNINKAKLIPVLKALGMNDDDLQQINELDFTKHLAFSIWEEPLKVDFITMINLVTYKEADKQKIIADCDGIMIPFLHLDHLILSKINTGRAKDAADIDELQKINSGNC